MDDFSIFHGSCELPENGLDRFSCFVDYWILTNNKTYLQTDRQAKYVNRYLYYPVYIQAELENFVLDTLDSDISLISISIIDTFISILDEFLRSAINIRDIESKIKLIRRSIIDLNICSSRSRIDLNICRSRSRIDLNICRSRSRIYLNICRSRSRINLNICRSRSRIDLNNCTKVPSSDLLKKCVYHCRHNRLSEQNTNIFT